jgi:site-specific DNA-methyltransferase (adenine-specific)
LIKSQRPAGDPPPVVRPVWEGDGLRLYHDDIRTIALPSESVDLIVTSPPYGVDIPYATYDDGIDYDRYLDFSRAWLARCLDLICSNGRLCLNLPLDKNRGGHQSVYADVLNQAKEVGWKYFSTIIWNEQNISRRTAWGSWRSASAPHVIAPVEVVVLLYKGSWEKRCRGVSDIGRDEFIEWTNGLWTFPGASRSVGHPAPFPRELPRRLIRLFSYVGDTVLDPFAGAGTTLLVCRELKRRGIAVEISSEYCELIARRLDALPGSPPPRPIRVRRSPSVRSSKRAKAPRRSPPSDG